MRDVIMREWSDTCPVCGSGHVEGDGVSFERGVTCDKMVQTVSCWDCGAKWSDVYMMTASYVFRGKDDERGAE